MALPSKFADIRGDDRTGLKGRSSRPDSVSAGPSWHELTIMWLNENGYSVPRDASDGPAGKLKRTLRGMSYLYQRAMYEFESGKCAALLGSALNKNQHHENLLHEKVVRWNETEHKQLLAWVAAGGTKSAVDLEYGGLREELAKPSASKTTWREEITATYLDAVDFGEIEMLEQTEAEKRAAEADRLFQGVEDNPDAGAW